MLPCLFAISTDNFQRLFSVLAKHNFRNLKFAYFLAAVQLSTLAGKMNGQFLKVLLLPTDTFQGF
jgi:hypothetical protein